MLDGPVCCGSRHQAAHSVLFGVGLPCVLDILFQAKGSKGFFQHIFTQLFKICRKALESIQSDSDSSDSDSDSDRD